MRLHQRLGASILLTLLSLLTIFFLLPTAGVSAGLQRIALGTSIDQYAGGLWTWVKGKDGKSGSSVRVVVFGDSWADGMGMVVEEGREVLGRGRCWAGWLCEEVNCSALLSFAASQPSAAYPASPPTGAVTWKQLYTSPPVNLAMSSLPDLATQIQEYLSSQSDSAFQETIFAISFGFWDIYHLAGLDYGLAQNMTDAAVGHLVSQINLLYTHFMEDLSNHPRNESSSVPSFKLVIPKLFDPTLAPGWISQRSMPLSPSSVAEQQKQAVYLTERWNSLLENALGSWVAADANANNTANKTDTAGNEYQATLPLPRKDIFYYDLPQYILDIIIEHQLEDAGQSDAAGLGKGESPFVSVAEPCLRDGAEDEKEEDGVWNTVCPDPSAYLFWDGFNLGGTANAGIGTKIAEIVNKGMRIGG